MLGSQCIQLVGNDNSKEGNRVKLVWIPLSMPGSQVIGIFMHWLSGNYPYLLSEHIL